MNWFLRRAAWFTRGFLNTRVDVHFIYVIAPAHGNPPCKIGISRDPDRRAKQLQTGFPEPLVVHHREPVDAAHVRRYERLIQRDLHHVRRHGEWFALPVADAIGQIRWTVIHYEAALIAADARRTGLPGSSGGALPAALRPA